MVTSVTINDKYEKKLSEICDEEQRSYIGQIRYWIDQEEEKRGGE